MAHNWLPGWPPGQGFGRLRQQPNAGRAQQQKLPGSCARTPALVNHAAQHGKQARCALHFVQNDQTAGMRCKKRNRVRQLRKVIGDFKIQVER